MTDTSAELGRAQARLEAAGVELASLRGEGAKATPLHELVERLVREGGTSPDTAHAFRRGMTDIAAALLEHFPDNIFWDLDYLGASLLERAHADDVRAASATVVRLMEGFGRHGTISFRYAHDFLYGYDWSRWVQKDPQQRAGELPFGPGFFVYIEQRMHQLRELIAAGDQKYGPLQPGERWRNPFGFSRELADERRLLAYLAKEDAIPVAAWDVRAKPDWRRPYAEIRQRAAAHMGIAV